MLALVPYAEDASQQIFLEKRGVFTRRHRQKRKNKNVSLSLCVDACNTNYTRKKASFFLS